MSNDHLWQNFFQRQVAGHIPFNSKFYIVDQPVQVGSGTGVQIVSPTEKQVEQARSAVKHKLKEQRPKLVKRRKIVKKKQKGGKKTKKKQPIKKRKATKKKVKRRI